MADGDEFAARFRRVLEYVDAHLDDALTVVPEHEAVTDVFLPLK